MPMPDENASLQTNRFFIVFCHSLGQLLGFKALGYSLLVVQAEHYILQAISICALNGCISHMVGINWNHAIYWIALLEKLESAKLLKMCSVFLFAL